MPRITAGDVRDMSLAERIQLVEDIWDDIAEDAGALTLTDGHKRLLDERLASLDAHPERCLSRSGVKARP